MESEKKDLKKKQTPAPAAKNSKPTKKVTPAEVTETEEEKKGAPAVFTAKMKKNLTDEVKKALKTIDLTLTTLSYGKIRTALKISSKNPSQTCTYAIDKITRVTAIPAFALTALPLIADINDVYEELLPLAAVGRGFLSPPDKATRDLLTKNLKEMLADNASSCATLSAGNLPLFKLTGYGVRKSNEKHGSAPMCNAKTDNKKGAGKMGVSCDAIEFIDKYIIYYGITPDYDPKSWLFKIGSSNQTITGLTSGVPYYFIMVAIGTDGEGEWMEPIRRVVPFA